MTSIVGKVGLDAMQMTFAAPGSTSMYVASAGSDSAKMFAQKVLADIGSGAKEAANIAGDLGKLIPDTMKVALESVKSSIQMG